MATTSTQPKKKFEDPKKVFEIDSFQESAEESVIRSLELWRCLTFWHDQKWAKKLYYDPLKPIGLEFAANLYFYFKGRDFLKKSYKGWWIVVHDKKIYVFGDQLSDFSDASYFARSLHESAYLVCVGWEHHNPMSPYESGVMEGEESLAAPDVLEWDDQKQKYKAHLQYHQKEGQAITYKEYLDLNDGLPIKTFWGGKYRNRPCTTVCVSEQVGPLNEASIVCPATGMCDSGCPLCCIQDVIWTNLKIAAPEHSVQAPETTNGRLFICGKMESCKSVKSYIVGEESVTTPNHNFCGINVLGSELFKRVGLLISGNSESIIGEEETTPSFVFDSTTKLVLVPCGAKYLPPGFKREKMEALAAEVKNLEQMLELQKKLAESERKRADLLEYALKKANEEVEELKKKLKDLQK